jgi:hypothetical protein
MRFFIFFIFFISNSYAALGAEEQKLTKEESYLLEKFFLLKSEDANLEEITNEFREIFFDEHERLLSKERDYEENKKAKNLAKENVENIIKSDRSPNSNSVLRWEKYKEKINMMTIEKDVFGKNYFRILSTNPKKLIKEFEEDIEKLRKNFLIKTNKILIFFKEERNLSNPKMSELYENYLKTYDVLSTASQKQKIFLQVKNIQITDNNDKFHSECEKLRKITNKSKISEEEKQNIFSLLDKISHIQNELLIIQDIHTFQDFEDDTKIQIESVNKKIEFIKKHPMFFTIFPKLRSRQLGIHHPVHWKQKTEFKLGDNILVGVIDSFGNNFKFKEKCSNPDKILYPCGSLSHGSHVAGLIVGDERALKMQQWNDLSIGVAPRAKFTMFNLQDVKNENFPQPDLFNPVNIPYRELVGEIDWSMSKSIERPSSDFDGIKIFNMSLGDEIIKQNRAAKDGPYGSWSLLYGLVQLLNDDRLVITSIGNEGVSIDQSLEYRTKKALSTAKETSQRYLMVTNLLQDGLHLDPRSNTPGVDQFLQNRTLSALGRQMISSIDQAESAGDYAKESGTSMAAAQVTGVAAVLLSNFPSLTAEELATCLLEGAVPILINDKDEPYLLKNSLRDKTKNYFTNSDLKNWIKESETDVTQHPITPQIIRDWDEGKKLYGMGRVNLEGALYEAISLFKRKDPKKDYSEILRQYEIETPDDIKITGKEWREKQSQKIAKQKAEDAIEHNLEIPVVEENLRKKMKEYLEEAP